MQPPISLLLRLELIWWALTAVVLAGVLLPIRGYWETYPFFWTNVIFLVVFVTLARYIFLLPYTFLANRQRWKVILVFLCIPLVFLLVQEINRFQVYLDNYGLEALLGQPGMNPEDSLISYTYSEMLLFGVGSVISGVIFPFRLLLSVWRRRNRGTA
jgi:hypothetical protein